VDRRNLKEPREDGAVDFAGLVTLDLSTAPRAWLSCTLSAAGLQGPGEVAPGEILTLVGAGLGPSAGAAFTLVNGAVPRELQGTRVLFDGQPAPVLYAQNGQVNAIAPYSLIPGTTVTLDVEYNGMRLGTPLTVTPARPRIFTLDGSGSGYAAALNQDGSTTARRILRSRARSFRCFSPGQDRPRLLCAKAR